MRPQRTRSGTCPRGWAPARAGVPHLQGQRGQGCTVLGFGVRLWVWAVVFSFGCSAYSLGSFGMGLRHATGVPHLQGQALTVLILLQ